MKFLYPAKPMEYFLRSQRLNQDWVGWVGEAKYDGWRVLLVRENDETVIYTRHKKILDRVAIPQIPKGTILDGELLGPRHKGEKHNQIYLFDVLMIGGDVLREMTLRERRRVLEGLFKIGVVGKYKISLAPQYRVSTGKSIRDLFTRLTRNKFVEGVVLKDLHAGLKVFPDKSRKVPCYIKIKR